MTLNLITLLKMSYSGLESSKNLSSSAPGAISDEVPEPKPVTNASFSSSFDSCAGKPRISKDSAMEDENCRSLSAYTDSTEQSAPVNFDMSNRVCVISIFFIPFESNERNILISNCHSRQNYHEESKIFDLIWRMLIMFHYSSHYLLIVQQKQLVKC